MRVTMVSLHMLKQCILDVPFRLFNFLKVHEVGLVYVELFHSVCSIS